MSSNWDPDPDSPHIEVVITKTGRMVGLKAGDAPGPQAYPFVQMIGVGTPVDQCQDIDIGDRLKSINGVFLKGKSRSEIHRLVREIPEDTDIVIKVIKSFKDKKFITDMGNAGFRVASVRRTNPLLAMGGSVDDYGDYGDTVGEDDEVPVTQPIGEEEIAEIDAVPENHSTSVPADFDGFGEDEIDIAAPPESQPKSFGGFKRKASVYGGFGDEPASDNTGDGSAVNTIDVNGEEFGFSEMTDDTWG